MLGKLSNVGNFLFLYSILFFFSGNSDYIVAPYKVRINLFLGRYL